MNAIFTPASPLMGLLFYVAQCRRFSLQSLFILNVKD